MTQIDKDTELKDSLVTAVDCDTQQSDDIMHIEVYVLHCVQSCRFDVVSVAPNHRSWHNFLVNNLYHRSPPSTSK